MRRILAFIATLSLLTAPTMAASTLDALPTNLTFPLPDPATTTQHVWMTQGGVDYGIIPTRLGYLYQGTSAPGTPFTYQGWWNTTTNPTPLNYYDGSQWVTAGSLDRTNHAWITPNQTTVPITRFGAKCDNSTDDSAAIQTAIRYGQTNAVTISFPSGPCIIGSAITGNGTGQVWIQFNNTILVQTHAGTAFSFSQSAVNLPVFLSGNVTFTASAGSASAGAIAVSFPTSSSVAQTLFASYGNIACYSTSATVNTPYPATYTNCLTLNNVWNGVSYGLNYTGAILASGLNVAGTSAVNIGGTSIAGVGNGFYNLEAFHAASAVWLTGYTEGIYVINPQLVDCDFGIRVGSAMISPTNTYVGPSGITAIGGLYANLIQVTGGEFNTNVTGVMCDRCQNLLLQGTHFFNAGYDGVNPYRAIVLNDSVNSVTDGWYGGSSQNHAGEAGVLMTSTNSVSSKNRIRGTVDGLLVGISLGSSSTTNDVDVTLGNNVTTPVTDSGTSNRTAYTSGSSVNTSNSINITGNGVFTFKNNLAGATPALATTSGLLGVNFSSSAGEVDFFNLQSNATEFRWYGLTPGPTANLVGTLNISGFFVGSTSALANNAVGPFMYIPATAGVPSGTPTIAAAGQSALINDTTNHKICFYEQVNAAWKCATGS